MTRMTPLTAILLSKLFGGGGGGGGGLTMRQWTDILSLFRAAIYDTSILADPSAVIDDLEASISSVPATGITLSENTLSFSAQTAQTVTATLAPATSTDAITAESSDTDVATVSVSGMTVTVTPVADGSATVTVTTTSGISATVSVSVDLPEPYTVTNTLTGCTNSNSAATVNAGDSYSATITANTDYTLSSVTVTMGGVDISSTAVSGGSISIASVTGNLVITAVATTHVLYALAQPYIASGQSDNYINTRLNLTETDKSFSIAGYIKFDDAFPNLTANMQIMYLGKSTDNTVFGYALYTSMYSMNGSVSVSPGTPANYNNRQNVKFVITHTAGADDRNIKLKYFDQVNAEATNRVCSGSGTKAFVSCENPIYIGKRDDGYGICNNLTVQTFKVFDYVMSAEEIDAYIGTEEATV